MEEPTEPADRVPGQRLPARQADDAGLPQRVPGQCLADDAGLPHRESDNVLVVRRIRLTDDREFLEQVLAALLDLA